MSAKCKTCGKDYCYDEDNAKHDIFVMILGYCCDACFWYNNKNADFDNKEDDHETERID